MYYSIMSGLAILNSKLRIRGKCQMEDNCSSCFAASGQGHDPDCNRPVSLKTRLEVQGKNIGLIVEECYRRSFNAGWYHNPITKERLERNVPEMLCLIHSEISEALEGYRKNLNDDKLPHRKMIEVELADALIRIADLAGYLGLDLGGAYVEKLLYNETRSDHKSENRVLDGGKKF